MYSRIISWIFNSIFIILTLYLVHFMYQQIGAGQLDKLAHFSVFALLTLAFWQLCKLPLWMTFVALCSYAAISEIGHLYLTTRSGSYEDFTANLCGVFVTVLILRVVQGRNPQVIQ